LSIGILDLPVPIQARVARNKFCCGRAVRAVRAGSIARDDPKLEENTASPKWRREALAPPSPRRSQRLMIPTNRLNPPGQGTSWPLRRSSIHHMLSPGSAVSARQCLCRRVSLRKRRRGSPKGFSRPFLASAPAFLPGQQENGSERLTNLEMIQIYKIFRAHL